MLTLPPKMRTALDAGIFEPVVYAEITTAVLDAPPAQQTKSYFRTAEGNDGVELLYPAQAGDPTQTETLYRDGFTDRPFKTMKIAPLRERPFFQALSQSFTMGEDILSGKRLKKIRIKVTRFSGIAGFELRCRLYTADASGNLVDPHSGARGSGGTLIGGAGVESSTVISVDTIPASPTSAEIDYNFDRDLLPGQRYAVFLYLVQTIGSVSGSTPFPRIGIFGSDQPKSGEFLKGLELSEEGPVTVDLSGQIALQVDVPAYSYDGVTNSWIDYTIDLQGTPVSEGFISIQDARPTFFDPVTGAVKKTDISYQLWAGNSLGAKDIDLGAAVDGSKITTLRRYYVLRASLRTANTTTLIRTPTVKKINLLFPQVVAGLAKVYAFSSHALPFSLAPAVEKAPSLPTKLDPRNHLTQRGSFTLQLVDLNGEVTRIATEEHLLNLPVEIRVGHRPDAADKTDLVLVATGKIIDYDYEEGRLSLTVEDRTKQLSVKVPKPANGDIQRRDYAFKDLVDVIEDIIANDAGISRRYIDTGSFSTVKSFLKGSDAASKWITHRVLKEPTEAASLVNEILQLIGAYLVVREDGLLTLIQYPRSGTSVAAWDETILSADDHQPAGLPKSIVNQCIVLYDTNGNGENEGAVVILDADAQNDWAPGAEVFVADRLIKTGWLGPEVSYNGKTIAERIGRREVKAKKDGMAPYRGKTGLDQFAVQVGDYVAVTSPAFLRKNALGMTAKQFMVLAKDPRWDDGVIAWELMEAIDANRPPTAIFTATPDKGLPPLAVTFNGSGSVDPDGTITTWEWDFDYDGVNFTVDAVGATPAAFTYQASAAGIKTAALRVTDNNGAQHIATKIIRILKAPVALIHFEVSAPDQPLFASLSSGSYGVTGAIVKTEWDLSYDGVTFNSEVTGPAATVNLPYQSITVALRVTDEDGLTATTTLTLTGKTFAPADVTGFFISQIGDKALLRWNENADVDLYAYEVRRKYEPTGLQTATWEGSDLVAREILTNSVVTIAQRPFGTYTYLVKAINTTGRYSINAVAILTVTLDPQDRNVLVTRDEKALGWTGTKVQLVHEVANNRFWIDAPGDINAMADTPIQDVPDTAIALVPSGTFSQGTYETSVIDLGGVLAPVRLSAIPTTISTPNGDNTQAVVEYRTSNDNIIYTPYKAIDVGDLSFRYLQMRVTLKQLDNASNIALENLVITIDVPDLIDSNEDLDVAIGGTAVLFAVAFNIIPSITTTIQNLTAAHFVEVFSKSKTGFSMRVRRASDGVDVGSAGTRLVDWQAIGY